ncbi:MAG: LacI family DNA-binding transcriptional regulator [Bacillota bacterium]
MGKATIYDVAKKAEVGIGTVSRVLNESQNVSDKTREKVIEAIQNLNYYPNAMARGLASQKTGSIGVIVPSFTDHFFVEVLQGVQQSLEQFDLDLVLFNVTDKSRKDKYIERVLGEKRVDGVIAITMDMSDEDIVKFQASELPLVLIDDWHQEVSSIAVDDISGSQQAVEYLLSLGHQKIAFLSGVVGSHHGDKRLAGVKKAFAATDVEFDSDLVIEEGFTVEGGKRAIRELLQLDEAQRPTAVFAASDNQAIGALEEIRETGLSVPEDIAIVGYDNIELAHYLKLTTISQPMSKMGRLGVEILTDKLEGAEQELVQQVIKPELVIREST